MTNDPWALKMLAAHKQGMRDYREGRERLPPTNFDVDERNFYRAGYHGAKMRDRIVVMCEECGKNPADLPSRICPGCEAYREHQQ
jgi:hypothetical protein